MSELEMRTETMRAEMVRLQAENDDLKAKASKRNRLHLKVSEKGGISLYGNGRFPVTLYREQWERVLDAADEIRAFMAEHASELTSKSDKPKTSTTGGTRIDMATGKPVSEQAQAA